MIDIASQAGAPYYDTDVDLVLQQIDILFTTRQGDVLGDDAFGTEFERYLYDMMQTNSNIEEYCRTSISNNIDLMGFNLDVACRMLMGELNDIILLTVKLEKEGTIYEKTYKID